MSQLIPLLNVEDVPDSASSTDRSNRTEFADIVLYIMCEDARDRREKLLAAGLDVSQLHQEDYGNDEFAVRDPDGYAVRFSSPRA